MPPTELAMSLGKKIRAIRTAKDMKITEMARLSGLTTSMISQMAVSYTHLVVSYPKACILLQFSNRFRDRRSR